MTATAQAAPADLKRRAARGGVVTTGGQVIRLVLQVGGVAVLARLLSPAEYGLVAIALIPVAIGEIFREFGLSAAAVQAPEVTRAQRNGLFWANTALGALMTVIAFGLAQPLAWVFDQPDVAGLARVLSLIFVVNGIATQYRASLTRDLRFAAIAGSDIAAQVLGLAAGVAAALAGWGYWSLAVMQLAQAALTAVFVIGCSRWAPGWPRRGADLGYFWTYGRSLVGSQIVHYIGTNADTMILGYRLGPEPLGLYDRAYRLSVVPLGQMRGALATVALPVLSRVSDDHPRFERALLQGQVVLGYALVPFMALIAGASVPLVGMVLGPQWSASAPILGVLAFAGGMQLLAFIGYWIYLSRGLTKQLFQYTFVSVGVRVSCILVGSAWGAVGVAVGLLVASTVLWPTSLLWLARNTDVPLRAIMLGAVRILSLATLTTLLGLAVVHFSPWPNEFVQVGLAVLAAAAVYGAGALVPAVRRDELVMIAALRSVRNR